MKFHVVMIGFLLALGLFSCQKEDQSVFKIAIEQPLSIDAGLTPRKSHYFIFKDVVHGFKEQLQRQGIDPATVSDVRGQIVLLEILLDDESWSFVQDASVIFYKDVLDQKGEVVFERRGIPGTTNHKVLIYPYEKNLQTFFEKDALTYALKLTTRGANRRSLNVRIRCEFSVITS